MESAFTMLQQQPKNRLKYFYPAKGGRWKYLRDVPAAYQELLGRKRWDFSLGSDYAQAVARCVDLTREHERVIAMLKNDENRNSIAKRFAYEDATEFAELVLGYESDMSFAFNGREVVCEDSKPTPPSEGWIRLVGNYDEDPKQNLELWRTTEEMLGSTESLPETLAYERLANFAAVAFGDTSFPVDHSEFAESVLRHSPPERPDGASGAVFDALYDALKNKLRQLSVVVSPDAPDRMNQLVETYARHKALRDTSVGVYKRKLKRFEEFMGRDPRVGEITRAELQAYRDDLQAPKDDKRPLQVTSVKQYMAPVAAILAFAFDEGMIETNPAAGLKMPVDPKRVEDRKQLPFSDEDVRRIIEYSNGFWGDENSKSRLSLERRRLFRHTVTALLHTGARPHELWRLQPEDAGTHTQNGWNGRGFDIRDTKSGVRLIPCPDAALPLADFIADGSLRCLSQSGEDAPTPQEVAHMVKAFADHRQFGKVLTDLQIKRPRVSLYSSRTTFVTKLQHAGCADGLIQDVIGHVGSAKMLRHYKSRNEMAAMLDAMESISYYRTQ